MNLAESLCESFMIEPEGLPIIDTARVDSWVESHASEANRREIWAGLGDYWIELLAASAGENYWILDSEHFCVLTSEMEDTTERFTRFCERAYQTIRHQMKAVAEPHPFDRHFVLLFNDIDLYYQYISPYFPEKSDLAQSSGIFISTGYPHFAMPSADTAFIENVIAHELSHAAVAHLKLPVWVDEGLAQKMEEIVLKDNHRFEICAERAVQHQTFWNAERINEFWSGDAFSKAGESNDLSYDLSRIMIELISVDKKHFLEFVRNATSEDGGAKAAKVYLGRALEEIAYGFLGPVIYEKVESTHA